MPSNESDARRWEIAVDLTPRKSNGDRLVDPKQHRIRRWYLDHPEAWEVVVVAALPGEEQRCATD